MTDTAFIAAGSPRVVSRAIEEYAEQQRMVTALVVPWESDGETLSLAVTSAKADGWAIEHLNLGTIRLTDAGNDRTRVAVIGDDRSNGDAARPDHEKLTHLFESFARQIQRKFQVDS